MSFEAVHRRGCWFFHAGDRRVWVYYPRPFLLMTQSGTAPSKAWRIWP